MFVNPVLNVDFPDPYVTRFGDTYFAYATAGGGALVRAAKSSDLVHWESLPGALTQAAPWMNRDTWAPEVIQVGDAFLMYYSGRHYNMPRSSGDDALCISVATATEPEGPFVDKNKEPLVCQEEGSIDPTTFTDTDGTRYLIWKNDGNCCSLPTRLWIQELSGDGLTFADGSEPADLGVVNDASWEGALIEAPTLLERDGTYFLFFSANAYDTANYAVGYATSDTLTGPYVDSESNPILAHGGRAVGTGHQSILADDDGDMWMAYHAWDASGVGYASGGWRSLWIDPLTFENGQPVVHGPNASPQPVP
jgi:beta-xylosidase